MTQLYKHFWIVAVISAVSIASCKKESASLKKAVITGYDPRKCACCGGLMINFNEKTERFPDSFFLISNASFELGITSTTSFPVYCSVDTIQLKKCYAGTYVEITKFEKR